MAKKTTTLAQALWNSADELRSHMDANEYKNYLLGLVFYKYLSDHLLYKAADLLEEEVDSLEEAQKVFNEYQSEPHAADHILKFYIEYKYSRQITIDLAQKRYYNN